MRNLLLLLIPLYLGYHLFTLSRFPLPNYQEAVLASSAYGINKEGVDFIKTNLDALQMQMVQLSPAVTFANTFIIQHLDNLLFSHRLINLLFSVILVLLLFYHFTYYEKGSFKNASMLFILVFIVDPIFNAGFHGNGPVTLGATFLLLSLRKELTNQEYTFYSTLTSAFFMALSLLSYFPIVVFLPFLLVYKLIVALNFLGKRQYTYTYHLIFWPILLFLLYLPWAIYYPIDFLKYIEVEFTPNIPWENYQPLPLVCFVMIGAALSLLLYAVFQNKYDLPYKTNSVLFAGLILSFFAFNKQWSNDFLLTIPFFYLFVFTLLPLNLTTNEARYGRYTPIVILLVLNGSLLMTQAVYVLSDFRNRSSIALKEFIQKHIPADAPLIGDARNCFPAMENRNKYFNFKTSLELNVKLPQSHYQYAIISKEYEKHDRFAPQTLEYYRYQKVAEIRYECSPICTLFNDIYLFGYPENNLYSATVYKKKP